MRLIPYKKMGLYSQGNPFSWKMIIGTFLALILNFSTVGHGGGVWGGVRLILAYEAHGFTSILEKRHIFKATWGAFMGGGRMEGCWNGGVFYFLYTLGKLAKRGGGWLPSGAIEGCYPPGMLELSEILILVKNLSPKRRLSVNNLSWKKEEDSKRESRKWVSHRAPLECSRLLTRLRLTH